MRGLYLPLRGRRMTNLSNIAVDYGSRGYAVLPLGVLKQPLNTRGLLDATTDEETIRNWWELWPDALVGIRTGNGLVVIDVDVQHGGRLDPSWPLTLTARTRSGGWHLYYTTTKANVPNSVAKVAPGVDVRADGGYVVAPGSPGWEWASGGITIKPLPQALEVAVFAAGARDGKRKPFVPRHNVSEGGRNDYIARFTGWCILHELVSGDDLLPFVQQHNRDVCEPPLDDDEVARTVRSISNRDAWRSR